MACSGSRFEVFQRLRLLAMPGPQPHRELYIRNDASASGPFGEEIAQTQACDVFQRQGLADDLCGQRVVAQAFVRQIVGACLDVSRKSFDAQQIAAPDFAAGNGVALAGERNELNVLAAHVQLEEWVARSAERPPDLFSRGYELRVAFASVARVNSLLLKCQQTGS